MKLTIIAATGGIGRCAVEQALAAGHDVTTVVRDPDRLSVPVRAVVTDMVTAEPTTLASALAGADAVLSCLGPRSNRETGVASQGTRALATAMRATGVRRVVALSAAPVGTVPVPGRPAPPKHDPGDGLITRNLVDPLLKIVLRRQYADLARMEAVLRDSALDWTVLRPPRLTNQPLTGRYRTAWEANPRHGMFISRANVAHHMLQVLDEPRTIGRTIGIAV